LEHPGALHEIALVLRQLGGGPGADPGNAVPRFLVPAGFWAVLLAVALRRARTSWRDRVMVGAAAASLARELFMLVAEYGSHRGLFAFERIVWFYPPLEHAFELASEVLAGYAFLYAFRDDRRPVRAFLLAGLGATALAYAGIAGSWAAFVRAGAAPLAGRARVELAQHWGDLVFRVLAVALLAAVVAGLATAPRRGGPARLATAAFTALLLDHALMIVTIAAGLRPAWFLAPLRHNLHMWAVPALLGVYWWELAEEARAADARAAAAARLESLGLLAGGVAHDFNNLLAVISANVSAALRDAADPEVPGALEDARRAAGRGQELVAQLLAFSGGERPRVVPVDLGAVAAEMARLLRPRVPSGVALVVECPPGTAWVAGDPAQLARVALNLVVNGAQAMEGRSGTLRVESGRVEGTGAAGAPGARAFLRVTDQGVGMTAAQRARIFDPLFTTRAAGHGLGLAVVDAVVRAHGGAVEVESVPDRGSTFRVLLPLAPPPAGEQAGDDAEAPRLAS
jgi:signal transduction histidine kinase